MQTNCLKTLNQGLKGGVASKLRGQQRQAICSRHVGESSGKLAPRGHSLQVGAMLNISFLRAGKRMIVLWDVPHSCWHIHIPPLLQEAVVEEQVSRMHMFRWG